MAPAMNVRMWTHAATQRNLATLRRDGVTFVGPDEGAMACGEFGFGRMAEPDTIFAAILTALSHRAAKPLAGRRALVTAGPTLEPLDPVRVLTNRSSGRQGYAIAAALADLGATVTLVSGPTALAAPAGVDRVEVETAREMLDACHAALPVDVAVLTAAVADWRPETVSAQKQKKSGAAPAPIHLVENPDILATLSAPGPHRPTLAIGFAAETEQVEAHAKAKLARKGCDWIVANDVTAPGVMGGAENEVMVIDRTGVERWTRATKAEVATRLAQRIVHTLKPAP
jgi:phosphopantothenoylcysteine decarboxylase/phosphopantothenate--cysteine ligase